MRRAKTASYTYGPPIESRGERTNKTEAEACRDVEGSPSNRSAALDVARKEGIAPPTAALDAARTASYTYGPPIDSRGERTNKTEAEACRDVDRPLSNRFAVVDVARRTGAGPRRVLGNRFTALDAARKGGIAPPTAVLDATRKSGVLYTYGSPINYPGGELADKTEGMLTGHPVTAPRAYEKKKDSTLIQNDRPFLAHRKSCIHLNSSSLSRFIVWNRKLWHPDATTLDYGEDSLGLPAQSQYRRHLQRKATDDMVELKKFGLRIKFGHADTIDPAHWPCIPDEQTCDLQILIPTVLARRVERSSGRRYAFLARHVEHSGARSSGRRYAALARHVERNGAVTGRPVYVPTCHRFRLDHPLTARINWRSMSIPNTAPARRVERSSGRRYAFLARHVERSGAVNGIPVYVPTCHRFCLMPFLRAASSAAVRGAMPSLRATSSAAERLMGSLFVFLPATASVLSARSCRPNQLKVHMYKMPFLRAASSAAVGGAMPFLRATSSAAERLLGDPSTSLHATASVLSAAHRPNQLEAI
ncbi:hypothetical protein B0H14DRAFT_2613601 [Mycena olivaceomarginata]|nr:hypothetical protein B0H14DRAFT_2613601 [Mycena olivaceomarginata]